ncbi:class I SAM-dependent methyltransferase [Candidatus Bipolaricaulota bacterium]|jgi:SAM-dependent methyltransferase|nr:class I SAM-dependent methyltransferase [Candidatus Bipolaricaulota bacterium]
MEQKPYSKLAQVYDIGWGDFAESCQSFMSETLSSYGIVSGKLLELACGTGILATHLARLGHVVLGIDRSPEMIEVASSRGAHVSGVQFEIADMRAFALGSQFDAVLCLFDSLNYLTVLDDVEQTFRSVSSLLRCGGLFIFDFNRPLIYSAHNGETLSMKIDGGVLKQKLHYEVASRLARTVFRFPDGDVETHVQRGYELADLQPLLEGARLALREQYASFSRRAVSSLSERIVCVCQKISSTRQARGEGTRSLVIDSS